MAHAPKRPKASASLKVWQNWDNRMTAHNKREADKKKAAASKVSLIANDKKAKERLMSKHK